MPLALEKPFTKTIYHHPTITKSKTKKRKSPSSTYKNLVYRKKSVLSSRPCIHRFFCAKQTAGHPEGSSEGKAPAPRRSPSGSQVCEGKKIRGTRKVECQALTFLLTFCVKAKSEGRVEGVHNPLSP